MIRVICAVLLLCLCWGCRSAPVYQRFDGAHGYSEAQIEPEVYEVSFTGTPAMSVTDVRFYATLRAAELAAKQDRRYLDVLETSEAVRPGSHATAGHTTVHTHTTRDRRGHQFQTTTVQSTPAHVQHYEIALVRLIVRLLEEPTETALDALQLLHEGRQRKAQYGAHVEALLGDGDG